MLYNSFGIIQYYTVLYSAVCEDSNYTDPYLSSIRSEFTEKSVTILGSVAEPRNSRVVAFMADVATMNGMAWYGNGIGNALLM